MRRRYLNRMSRLAFHLRHRVTTSLWFIPVICVIAGVVLAVITIAIDRATDGSLLSTSITGDPNAAVAILSTAAASMVSLTALVLTITGVVVQLAMGQFSPRSVRPFLQDRPSQWAIGVFVGAFAHSILALREVHSFTQQGYVPSLTIAVSFVLMFASVVVLVGYVHHIGNSLKVDSIIKSVGEETRDLFARLYPDREPRSGRVDANVLPSDRAGFLFDADTDALVRIAADADGHLELLHTIGGFVAVGEPLFVVAGDVDREAVLRAVAVGGERTMDRDGAYGIQTLVDIAQRSASDNFSDPTTASQAIDRIHDCLRLLAERRLDDGRYVDERGEVRLEIPTLEWPDYVSIAFDPLLRVSAGVPQVLDRIEGALMDLKTVAPRERQAPLDARLERVHHSRAA
jgi:uncharacterized membrane protein